MDVLTGPERRRRWTAEQKLAMVRESFEPGKSVSLVARQHGVNPNQLFHWRKLYQDGSLPAVKAGEEVVPASELADALAFHLLLGCSMLWDVVLTAFDTVIVLGLKDKNFRTLEAIMAGLIATIGLGYVIELALVKPHWPAVFAGAMPSWQAISSKEPLYLAIGVLGATVMPHNLYLHSSIVQTRAVKRDHASLAQAIGWSRLDTIVSLTLALLINAAILILAAAAFHATGHNQVTEIEDAYKLLAPVLALIPAFVGVWLLGNGAVGKLPVASQVVLSLQLPFARWPLIRMTNDRALTGAFANRLPTRVIAWLRFAVITAANLWLVWQTLGGT